MTTPDPADPIRDDSPTTPVDLPPTPPAPPPAPPLQPPAEAASPPAGAAPRDVPGRASPPPSWTVSASPPPRTSPPTQPGLVTGIVLVVTGVAVLLIRLVDVTLGSRAPDREPR